MLDVAAMQDTPDDGVQATLKAPPGRRVKYQGRDRQRPLKVTVTPAEKAIIEARSSEAGLSVASYLRAAALVRQVRSVLDSVNKLGFRRRSARQVVDSRRYGGGLLGVYSHPKLTARTGGTII